jgi:DMSO reductase family type II enzyme chaperone
LKATASAAAGAAESSTIYRMLAAAATYQGATGEPFGISGADYCEAFDPSVSADACSLREGPHVEDDPSTLFEELSRFYAYFGLGRGEGAEMPDHLSVEFEFMHFLTHLEQESAGEPATLNSLWRAQHDFLQRHVTRLLIGVRRAMKSRNPQCVALVQACCEFAEAELQRTGQLLAS